MRYSLAILALAAAVVEASPYPQGVTSKITPTASAPPGCKPSYSAGGTFGIAVMNISTSAKSKRQVSTLTDGQPEAPTSSVVPVSTISDHQPQATTATSAVPVSTISDHQPQAPTSTAVPVSTISDHQPQAPTHTMAKISQIKDGQIQGGMHTVTMMPVSQITDGQIQATMTYMAVSTIVDGQPQAPTMPATITPVSTISDHQPQAPTSTGTATPVSTISDHQPQASTGTAVSTISDHQPQASTMSTVTGSAPASTGTAGVMVACKSSSTLEITLNDGVLTDTDGRTGYIAANYQFQFDKPPQAGAIYTAGWSICGNGSLALGGSNVFYQCLSGNFYNLYNEHWAAQCSPVTIETLMLLDCKK